ncbi:hypothetical protein ACFX2J_005106 [Malus domestica]
MDQIKLQPLVSGVIVMDCAVRIVTVIRTLILTSLVFARPGSNPSSQIGLSPARHRGARSLNVMLVMFSSMKFIGFFLTLQLNLQMVVLLLEGKDCNFTSICYCVPPSNHFMLVGKEEVKSDHDECKTNEDFPSIDPTTIAAATESFSVANKLGRGGFGSVYKGVFYNGNKVAVKRLRSILVKESKSLAMKSC